MLCDFCGEKLTPDATRCNHCGSERMVYCVQCGTPVNASAAVCPACQQPQPKPGSFSSTASGPRYTHPGDPFNPPLRDMGNP